MDLQNPYDPPQAPVEDPRVGIGGPLLPWEEPAASAPWIRRLWDTLGLFWSRPAEAGAGVAATPRLGPPIGFYVLTGLLPALAVGVLDLLHPVHPFWKAWLNLPRQEAPSGGLLAAALLGALFFGPLFVAIGFLILGALNHAGLWLARGTRGGRGLVTTYRSLLYTAGARAPPIAGIQAGQPLPAGLGLALQFVTALAHLGATCYQGVILAEAHGTDRWRGVLGVWLPLLGFGLCCGVCVGLGWTLGGEAFHEGLRQGLRGGR